VRAFLPAFDRHALACGERLRRLDGRVVPVSPQLVHATLDVVLETLFGEAGVDRDMIARDVFDYLDQLCSPDLMDIPGAPTWVPRPRRARARRTIERPPTHART